MPAPESFTLVKAVLKALLEVMLESWLWKLAVGVLFFLFAPMREAYLALAALIALDFLTGVYASKREGKRITSAIMRTKSFSKGLMYALTIAAFNMADRGIGLNILTAVWLGFLTLTEAISIIENLARVHPNNPALGFALRLLNLRRDLLESKGTKLTDTREESHPQK